MGKEKGTYFTKTLFSLLLILISGMFCLRTADVSQNSLLSEVEKIESGTSASTAPSLTSVNPADGQTGVATSTSIVLTFNTEMNTSTLIAQAVSGACTGSVQLSNDNFINCVGFQTNPVITENKSFKYTLAGNLNTTTQYRLKVTNSVKNTNGQSMTSDYVQSTGFQTGSGATTPSVISVNPNNNQTGVTTGSTISVTFSETMTPGTFTQTASDGTCTGSAQLQVGPGFTNCKGISLNSSDNVNLTITPASALAENTQYRLVFTTAIQSAGGIALASNFQSVFTTGDFTSPSVTNVTAAQTDGTYGVGSSLTIRVVFSENVVVTGTPTLQLETGNTDQTISYSSGSGSNTLEFLYSISSREDVNNDLDYVPTTALVTAGGSIKDEAGNNANLTLPAVGAAGSLSANKNIRIFTFNLPDTGQTQCTYDAGGNNWQIHTDCNDPAFTIGSITHPKGQDAHYLNENGSLNLIDAGVLVRETSTGLLFQKGPGMTPKTVPGATDPVNGCPSLTTDGRTWRLPSVHELNAHLDYGLIDPLVNTDPAFFSGVTNSSDASIADKFFWTSTERNLLPTGRNWQLNVTTGLVSFANASSSSRRVRCVTGNPYPANSFSLVDTAGQYSVADTTTNLVWTRCPLDNAGVPLDAGSGTCQPIATGTRQVKWHEALAFCENLTYAGKTDWRLPNVRELMSIVDYGAADPGPVINSSFFPETNPGVFWTSTSYLNSAAPSPALHAHIINFGTGDTGPDPAGRKDLSNRFYRCVRTGP